MSDKLSRREMLQASAAGAAGLAAAALPGAALAAAPQQDAVTLRFQINWNDYQEVIEAYQGVAPHVTVEPVQVTGTDHAEVATKILASLAAGTPVDIGYAAHGGDAGLRRRGPGDGHEGASAGPGGRLPGVLFGCERGAGGDGPVRGRSVPVAAGLQRREHVPECQPAERGGAGGTGRGLDAGRFHGVREGHDGAWRRRRFLRICLAEPAVGQLDAVGIRQRHEHID